MKDIDNQNLLIKALEGGCNLFLGAGFPIYSKNEDGLHLPLGDALKNELVTGFNRSDLASLDLPKLSSVLKSTAGEEFTRFLIRRFTVSSFSDDYKALTNIEVDNIFTTNIDDLIFKIYDGSDRAYINDVYITGPSLPGRRAINYIPLHGSIKHPKQNLVFSTTEIATAFSKDPDKWHFLRERITSRPTIFLGYGLEDAGILQALEPVLASHSAKTNTNWIIVHSTSNANIPYYRAIGLSVALGDVASFCDYVRKNIKKSVAAQLGFEGGSPVLTDFQDMQLPSLARIVSRPIKEYFSGMTPSWSDIYSGQVPILTPYKKVQDILAGKKHVLIIGAPASGKTTLAMQIAAALDVKGPKLFAEASALPTERARLLAKIINGISCMLFIDNYTEALDSVAILSSLPNFRLICADRAYNFEFTSHFIDLKRWQIVDATALTEADEQTVLKAIPPEIRATENRLFQMEGDLRPSIFEVVEANVTFPRLRERYVKILRDMEVTDRTAHDFLIMCCYVHRCRVPISFDMAYAFLRRDIADFMQVKVIMNRLGGLLADYRGEFMTEDQDYFVPRSLLFSDAILGQTSSSALHRVINKFHDEVTPDRIVRRDIFKRWAYDKDIIGRAFAKWEEGIEFYDKAMERDSSPYLKQQAALYCLKRKRFKEAFYYADMAFTQSSGNIFSIRNTFAVVQFASNIDVHEDGKEKDGVRPYLDASMEMLGECYRADNRKTYHSLEYGRQAIKYWQRYQDAKSEGYLKNALEWVNEEMKVNTWNRNLAQVRREIIGFLK
jgi:hypothetical protein